MLTRPLYANSVARSLPTDLSWVTGVAVGDDVSHERAVFDVLIITGHMDSVFSRLCGPVADITWPIILVLALDFSLRRSLDGKTWRSRGSVYNVWQHSVLSASSFKYVNLHPIWNLSDQLELRHEHHMTIIGLILDQIWLLYEWRPTKLTKELDTVQLEEQEDSFQQLAPSKPGL